MDLPILLEKIHGGTLNLGTWRREILPSFPGACRQTLHTAPDSVPVIAAEFRNWLTANTTEVTGQQGGAWVWQRAILCGWLESLEVVHSGRPSGLGTAFTSLRPAVRPLFSTAYRDTMADYLRTPLTPPPPSPVLRVQVGFPLVPPTRTGRRLIARFGVGLANSCGGTVFPHPETAAFCAITDTESGDAFAQCFTQAATEAKALLAHAGDQTHSLPDVFLSLLPHREQDRPDLRSKTLDGPSAGGALATALALVWKGMTADADTAITFALPGCSAIEYLETKVSACHMAGVSRLIVASAQQESDGAYPEAFRKAQEGNVRIYPVATLREAVELASSRERELREYLKRLEPELLKTSWTPERGRRTDGTGNAVSLDALYVPLDVREEVAERRRHAPSGETFDTPERLLTQGGLRAVLMGGAGEGKTVYHRLGALGMIRETRDALDSGRSLEELPIPLPVRLSRVAEFLGDSPSATLANALERSTGITPDLARWLAERARRGKAILLLDGLDQMPSAYQEKVWDFLAQMEDENWSGGCVITSRPGGVNRDRMQRAWSEARVFRVQPLTLPGIRALIGQWFGANVTDAQRIQAQVERTSALRQACSNPLICTLVCMAVSGGGAMTSGLNRHSIYRRALLRMLESPEKDADGKPTYFRSLDARFYLDALQSAASRLFREQPHANRFSLEQIHRAWINALTSRRLSFSVNECLHRCESVGILQPEGDSGADTVYFSFVHRSFVEHLAAEDMERRWTDSATPQDQEAQFSAHAWNPNWGETAGFFLAAAAARMDEGGDPQRFLHLLAHPATDDLLGHRVTLALAALPDVAQPLENRSDKAAQNLRDELNRVSSHAIHRWRYAAEAGWEAALIGLARHLRVIPAIAASLEVRHPDNPARNRWRPWRVWFALRMSEAEEPESRARALRLLGLTDPFGDFLSGDDAREAETALPALLLTLQSASQETRQEAVRVIGGLWVATESRSGAALRQRRESLFIALRDTMEREPELSTAAPPAVLAEWRIRWRAEGRDEDAFPAASSEPQAEQEGITTVVPEDIPAWSDLVLAESATVLAGLVERLWEAAEGEDADGEKARVLLRDALTRPIPRQARTEGEMARPEDAPPLPLLAQSLAELDAVTLDADDNWEPFREEIAALRARLKPGMRGASRAALAEQIAVLEAEGQRLRDDLRVLLPLLARTTRVSGSVDPRKELAKAAADILGRYALPALEKAIVSYGSFSFDIGWHLLRALEERVYGLRDMAPPGSREIVLPRSQEAEVALGEASRLAPLAIAALNDEIIPNWELRERAAQILGDPYFAAAVGEPGAKALAEAMRDTGNDPDLRAEAARALAFGYESVCRVFVNPDGEVYTRSLDELETVTPIRRQVRGPKRFRHGKNNS